MRNRTKARECALKILYAVDIRKDSPLEYSRTFWDNHLTIKEEVKKFRQNFLQMKFCLSPGEAHPLASKVIKSILGSDF